MLSAALLHSGAFSAQARSHEGVSQTATSKGHHTHRLQSHRARVSVCAHTRRRRAYVHTCAVAEVDAAVTAVRSADVPPPLDWQVWVGFLAGLAPVVIATLEFGKRIVIQRQCAACAGSGLVAKTINGEPRLVKCVACGGFLPWVSWRLFLRDTQRLQRVGNGGPLRMPRGQAAAMAQPGLPLYDVDAAKRASQAVAAPDARVDGGDEGRGDDAVQ